MISSQIVHAIPAERYNQSPIFDIFYAQEKGELVHRNVDTIVSDGDGTVYGTPTAVQPEVDTSPAHLPILNWIQSGQTDNRCTRIFLLITGNELNRTQQRFARHIPENLRPGVVLAANGGAVLYYHNADGKAIEDRHYRACAIEGGTTISQQVADKVIDTGVEFINTFFDRLRVDATLQEEVRTKNNGRCAFLLEMMAKFPGQFTKEWLITQNTQQVPRIEVRITDDGTIAQIAYTGVPFFYDVENPSLQALKDDFSSLNFWRINVTTEINVRGVDKQLVLRYLGINPQRAFALGDSPNENDKPLTCYRDMPFVSVCKDITKVSPRLHPLHIGFNMDGAARLIEALTIQSEDSIIQSSLEDIVKRVQSSFTIADE